jgi:hypothetical protein
MKAIFAHACCTFSSMVTLEDLCIVHLSLNKHTNILNLLCTQLFLLQIQTATNV